MLYLGLIAVALAASNAITRPQLGDTFVAGNTETIAWREPSGSKVKFTLMTGNPGNLKPVVSVGEVTNQGTVAWIIPKNIPSGKYSLQVVNSDNPDETNYSSFFNIVNKQNS